jgi:glycosyltransferase involved in cell wall biosynthesis
MSELPLGAQLPKVTIAIPTLNRVGYLRLALESALAQTYASIEVIVSNNASTDETSRYLASCSDPRLRVLHQTSLLPMTENWNACLAAATGDYFLLLSDDDLLDPCAVEVLVAGYSVKNGDPAPGLVYCGNRVIDAAGKEVPRIDRPSPLREPARDLIRGYFGGKRDLVFCAVLLHTDDLLPGFPTDFKVACDAAVWMKAALRRGPVVFVPRKLVCYRIHQNLTSATDLEVWRGEFRQLLELAIAEDRRSANPDPEFATQMRAIMLRSYQGLVAGRINESFRANKRRALLEYRRYLADFSGPVGLWSLIKGIVMLFLNEPSRFWVRQLFAKIRPC